MLKLLPYTIFSVKSSAEWNGRCPVEEALDVNSLEHTIQHAFKRP